MAYNTKLNKVRYFEGAKPAVHVVDWHDDSSNIGSPIRQGQRVAIEVTGCQFWYQIRHQVARMRRSHAAGCSG